jgi:hypothetical protein
MHDGVEGPGAMKQLTLELNGYPRPIAWTLSEVDRCVGDRDLRDMLLAAFEDITRYLTLVALARYSEYFANDRRSDHVENALQHLKRPSFGHYVRALDTLDHFLWDCEDPYALGLSVKRVNPAAVRLYHATGTSTPKQISVAMLLSRVVEIRNREKGHGYTGQYDARVVTNLLQPALIELLEQLPLLVARPLVWIERIEYLNPERWIVTFLELMGTQRARRIAREVRTPGGLEPRFVYMWNGESAPLQLTPFVHLEETGQDEIVYVLAGIEGDPRYQARGMAFERRPDQLLTQLGKRAPFLLKSEPTVTTVRVPDAAKHYRNAVDLALADGSVTPAEAVRLEAIRIDLGLSEIEAVRVHELLGWLPAQAITEDPAQPGAARDDATLRYETTDNGDSLQEHAVPQAASVHERDEAPVPIATANPEVHGLHEREEDDESAAHSGAQGDAGSAQGWPDEASRFAMRVREFVAERLDFEPELVLLDDELDVGEGELWIQLRRTQGVSLWFGSRREGFVRVVLGFYSTNERRDPAYRRARTTMMRDGGPPLPGGWASLTERSRAPTRLALETGKRFRIDQLVLDECLREAGSVLVALAERAAKALEQIDDDVERPAPLEAVDVPVAVDVPSDFLLPPLRDDPRIHGSVWIARILWALEWARRHDPAPKSAADIARILSANEVRVPPTNTARAFRVPRDDPRRTGLCDEPGDQRYTISASGRRALFELLAALDG